jgi:hypothetical protein
MIFSINRKTKRYLLNMCENIIRKNSSLKLIESVFERINQYYKQYLLLNIQTSNNFLANNVDSTAENSQLPIIEQYDMHNLLFHFVEASQIIKLEFKFV